MARTKLGLSVSKKEDFSKWYTEVITKSEMIEYYEDVSGCYILRPWSFSIWEQIQGWFDGKIKAIGVSPCYFPMFVSQKALETEKDHVEGFSAEVAWVTRSGASELDKPIAIRPTSETIMYPAFAKWIRSHRDLPLQMNQWTNVVRWEFKNPTPFLRTREFLWQEGHSAFADVVEADCEVLHILDLYSRVYEEVLSVPVIKGRKSEKEKFAGGDYTTTCEAYIDGSGRAIQAATSHSLGQNFSKMFQITYLKDGNSQEEKTKKYVFQNSWGLTTRSIGVAVMVHGDNIGLVLPPKVSPLHVVVVPIYNADTEPSIVVDIKNACRSIFTDIEKSGMRCYLDDRTDKKPGWKYNHWEQKGVPLRVEVGPKDIAKRMCRVVRRDNREKLQIKYDQLLAELSLLLDCIQADMLYKARKGRDQNVAIAWEWKEFIEALDRGCLILAPWCCTTKSEEWVKAETKALSTSRKDETQLDEVNAEGESKSLTGAAKTLCIPFNQPPLPNGTVCFTGNGAAAVCWCLWGRSY